jgi:hypothetical protein
MKKTKNILKRSSLIATAMTCATLSTQAATVATFDMGTLTTTGEDTTGWGGAGLGLFFPNATDRGSFDSPFWSVFSTSELHGTSSGGDTLLHYNRGGGLDTTYTVTFDAGWAFAPGSTEPDIASFQAFAWDGFTETALAGAASYDLSDVYNTWGNYEYTFSIADGSAVIGQELRLKFNTDGTGVAGVDTFQVTYSVPEPSSTALLGLGGLALALRRRRA